MLTPRPEQQAVISEMVGGLLAFGGCVSSVQMGVGKTLLAVETIKHLDVSNVLLIGPLSTRESWESTFAGQEVDMPFRWINSTVKGQQALTDYLWSLPGIYFVGIEMFGRMGFVTNAKGKKVASGVWNMAQPDMVVFDEGHKAQNTKSQTHKSLMQLEPKYRLIQSGTIAGNSFEGIHGPTRWAFPDAVQYDPWLWQDQWCATVYDPFAARNRKVVGERNPGAFVASLPCYVRLEADFGEPDDQNVYVELGPAQRNAYNDLVQHMVTFIQEQPVVVEFPITLRARLRQATLGMFSTNADGDVFFDDDCESPKLDALFGLLDGEMLGEKVLVFTDSAKFAKVTTARLLERYGVNSTVEWSGNVTMKARPANKKAFVNGPASFMVAVPAAAGTGTDGLQYACNHMVWLSQSDSRIDNEQATARLVRGGQNKTVVVRRIIATDTYDAGQLDKQIVDAMRMKGSISK